MASNDRTMTRWAFLLRFHAFVRGTLHGALRVIDRNVKARAVATPVADLTALLARLQRVPASHLQLERVARALQNREGLDTVPGTVLHAAVGQLDGLARTDKSQSPGLGVLRLQMRRQIVADGARSTIARSGAPMNWHPHREPVRHPRPRDYTPLFASDSRALSATDAETTGAAPLRLGAVGDRDCPYWDTVPLANRPRRAEPEARTNN